MSEVSSRTSTATELILCLGAPLIWAVHLFILYGGATLACLDAAAGRNASYVSFAMALTIMAMVVVAGLMAWQSARARQPNAGDPADGSRFLRVTSIMLGAAALLAIFWGALSVLMLPTCSQGAA
jgi:hypothetical protein